MEHNLKRLFLAHSGIRVLDIMLKDIKELNISKNKLFLEEEMEWRIESRATWVNEGDKKTKLFHNFVAHHKLKNTV